MIDGGALIVHIGGHDSGALTAFDAETGKTIWSWNGDGPGYASPIVVELAGTRQVVTQTQSNIVGVSAADGILLWKIPFTTAFIQNIITPILYKQTLIFSGLDKGVMAYKFEKGAGEWKTDKVWENYDVSFYMSTPVLKGDVLFGMSHKNSGQFVALDARTGKTLWSTEGREGDNTAILIWGDRLLLLNNEGELIVAKAGSVAFEPLRRYTVAKSPTWAYPLLVGKSILIKDLSSLTLWTME
jgi:outer membrane protein assembly factor BamB